MIGFFQNSMAKHHRMIFGVLLVFIVVSFVFYTGSGSIADLLGMRRPTVVMDVDLNNREEVAPFRAGVLLTTYGQRSATERDLVQRVFMVKTAELFQIPEPTQEEFSAFLSENGLSAEAIKRFEDALDVSEKDMRTAIVHSWKIQRFLQTFGNVPATFDADVKIAWNVLNTSWKVDFAELPADAVKIENREPSAEQLSAFYEGNKEDFRIAELQKISFAKIVPAADVAEKIADPTEFELTNFVAEKIGSDAEKVAAEIKNNREANVAEWKKSQALIATAADISNTLYEKLPTDSLRPGSPDFVAELEKSGLGFTEIPAFPRDRVPSNAPVPAEILQSVVGSLNETLWRTDAIPAGDGVFVVVFRGTEPSRIPALDEIKSEVVAAWREKDREAQFLVTARAKGSELSVAVSDGKKFDEAATALGFKIVSPDAFTLRSIPADFASPALIEMLRSLPENKVSPMIEIGTGRAVFAKIVSKTVPAIDEKSEEYKNLRLAFDRQTSWQTFQIQLNEAFSPLVGGNAEE